MPPSLQFKILRAAETPDAYRLYRAGLEYDLADPIVIESAADVKSTPLWRDRVEPFHHQVTNLITFCRRLPVTLLADDVGLGKTISAGLIMSELMARGRVRRVLVVCPKLLGPQWKEELETKFAIPAEIVTGQELVDADPEASGAVITTYHTARTHLDKLPPDRFEMLVLDEAHKLRNLHGTPHPPQVARVFETALAERRFRYVLMLTATPIQNRLWDLYSLVDLLTVARGHVNPFGSEGQFARKFIAGDREQARHLKPGAAEDFRAIVYGYMSRVRRGDAKLHFPTREVRLLRVAPTPAELELIKQVAAVVRPLNRLAQIGILQASISSPEALAEQLDHMAEKGSVSKHRAEAVREIVRAMLPGAKLARLAQLIDRLRRENAAGWRLVVFTGRRETQTAVQLFLEKHGLNVGLINGTSGPRNQATLAAFRADPPAIRVIVSTEAGSEGVNLQVANVLVNYDLPWNPMIVEQRIGRVQRLGSTYAHVSIFNLVLKETFEETIVGRLMEKLQMSTSAIGDLESLLEGAVGDEDGAEGFEEKIRHLVLASLEGANVDASVRQAQDSIEMARATLADEEKRIDELLGGDDGRSYVGPRAPSLPRPAPSMPPVDFGRAARRSLGEPGEAADTRSTLDAPGTPAFARLVQRVVASGVHVVRDAEDAACGAPEHVGREWTESFGATDASIEILEGRRRLDGSALVRVRAAVAHDAYERLIDVACTPTDRDGGRYSRAALAPMPPLLQTDADLGIDAAQIVTTATQDAAVAEFSRFYLERRAQEMAAAGQDERQRRKMEDDFTPRLTFTLVGAEGTLVRDIRLRVAYRVDEHGPYGDDLVVRPSTGAIVSAPAFATCTLTHRSVPVSCFGTCAISGRRALQHRLGVSALTKRTALPEHMATCEASGDRLLADEVERSTVTGRLVSKALVQTSTVSGKKAEAEHVGRCAFSGDVALVSELRTSDVSGKPFRADAAVASAVSGRVGHRDEFVVSSVSGLRLLPEEAVRSAMGTYCAPAETRRCQWSGRGAHPDDLRTCSLTGLDVLFEYVTSRGPPRLEPLVRLLDGVGHETNRSDLWGVAANRVSALLGGARCRVEAAFLSPDKARLAVIAEVRTLFGLRTRQAGYVYAIAPGEITGRIALGKRGTHGWLAA